LQQITPDW